MALPHSDDRLHHSLAEISRLLDRHRVLETLAHQQDSPRRDLVEQLQHRQNVAELGKRLRVMHAADIAHVLEGLPLDDRTTVWHEVAPEQAADVLVEVSVAVRGSLVDATDEHVLIEMLAQLDPEDLAYVSPSLPDHVSAQVEQRLEQAERTIFEDSIRFPASSVGYVMTREWVEVSDRHTVGDTLAELRRLGAMPPQTDHVFVVDVRHVLRGSVPLPALLISEPATPILALTREQVVTFSPMDDARSAVGVFERYDLVSAPVVDNRGKLVGRLTVDAVMDVLRDESSLQALRSAGLSNDEDLFASLWDSARNRWPWLAINLVTAFVASRVIGQFEGVIQQLAALAALMPIVASIGGNTGNQTMALVIRSLATDQIQPERSRRLLTKELSIGILNGSVWGLVVGGVAGLIYAQIGLGLVMTSAVVLNLVVAAAAGVLIPLGLHASGRDPAHGASVLLTFITDGMGFFLFLGLAWLFLV
ncbi:MAG: magnesium transporter [Vicinamibacterales bacterium]